MEPPAASPAQPGLNAALDRLWARFLPEIRERVSIIESAVQSLAAGSLSAEEKEAASSAAHKLAGVLGTFSLQRGTDLARELELSFSATPGNPAHLAALASELRAIIESRR
jgi:HPt (histidine-containing phosphotransfer) domain-containing protein